MEPVAGREDRVRGALHHDGRCRVGRRRHQRQRRAPKGDTPWTGEADADAVDAETVVESLANPASAAEKGARSLTPDPPWGNPRLRLTLWSLASAILLVAAVVLIVFSDVASLLVALVAIVAVTGTLHGIRVSRLERRIAQTPNLEGDGSRLRRWLRRLQSHE